MDKFALHLAFENSAKKQQLATNTVMSYYRHVKNWLLDMFPQCRVSIEDRILEMARILEKYCSKRNAGGMTTHARACTKQDLALLMQHLYVNASKETDYQDAALLCIMWYIFGRASDLSLLQKQSISVCAGNNFFLRLVRIKTTEQQCLTLHPDTDVRTCPILAIAIALATQTVPCVQLLQHIKPTAPKLDVEMLETLPLCELLVQAEQSPGIHVSVDTSKSSTALKDAPGIHNQVNRLLGRVRASAGVDGALSSHSFRRGGAQHANGNAQVSIQWIMDRGGWNLSTTHKVFSYVFNTTQEDQRVSKVLSGWEADSAITVDCLDMLDAEVLTRVRVLQGLVFSTCVGLHDVRMNLCARALDACTARLLRALPQLRGLSPDAPIIAKVDLCASKAGIRSDELLQWAVRFEESYKQDLHKTKAKTDRVDSNQAAVIRELLKANQLLVDRLEALESKVCGGKATYLKTTVEEPSVLSDDVASRHKKAQATYLSTVWYAWYGGEPHLWLTTDRKKRSDAGNIVAFMKLFLPNGITLIPDAADYRDRVLVAGAEAERELLTFLQTQGIRSRGASAVLKHMRALHDKGKLDERIRLHKTLLELCHVVDPAPRSCQVALKVRE